MNIDGKTNVKERIKVFENNKFITYLYIFENGNSYRETVDNWKQRDFTTDIKQTEEDRLDKYGYKIKYRR